MLQRFSKFLAVLTFFLVLAGGLVTSHQAGLAVPDWPLSYGRFFPPMVGNIFWEHGHRMIAGSVGMLTLVLAIWVQIQEKRIWLKRLAWIAFGAVVLQALLGGLTVLFLLPAPVSIFHACLAQTFFCLVVSIAYFLSFPAEKEKISSESSVRLRRLLAITASFIYAQLILGAIVRHTHHGIPVHIGVAFLVAIHVLLVTVQTSRSAEDKFLINCGLILGFITVIQVFLGMGSFIFTRMIPQNYAPSFGAVAFTAAHQTLGALVLALSVLLNLRAWR